MTDQPSYYWEATARDFEDVEFPLITREDKFYGTQADVIRRAEALANALEDSGGTIILKINFHSRREE
jgi:threonyl-tRNA synthetase